MTERTAYPWDGWVKTCGEPTVWCGFDWPETISNYVVLPQQPACRYPDCDGGSATGYCHIDCRVKPWPSARPTD